MMGALAHHGARHAGGPGGWGVPLGRPMLGVPTDGGVVGARTNLSGLRAAPPAPPPHRSTSLARAPCPDRHERPSRMHDAPHRA
eukprot:6951185-Prymnesium_polylepis.2